MQPPQHNHVILLGSSVRAATASAVAAGLQVTAVDAFGDADLRGMCRSYHPLSPTEFPLAFLRMQPPSLLVPLGGCERWGEQIASLGPHHWVAGATAEQWRLAKELSVLREIAQAAGVGYPASYAPADGPLRPPTNGNRSSPRWLVKKRSSCGGLGVRWSDGAPIAPDEYYQRWTRGRGLGASYLASGEATHLLGACRGLKFRTGSYPAIYAGSSGPLRLSAEWAAKLVRLGQAAAQRLELCGLFNIDLLWHPAEGLSMLEINPRYTASMELHERSWADDCRRAAKEECGGRASGPSLIDAHLQCFFGPLGRAAPLAVVRPMPAGPMQRAYCKRVVFTRREILFDARNRRSLGAIVEAHSAQWADVPVEGTVIPAERPLCSVLTAAESVSAAARRAARVAVALRAAQEPPIISP